MEFLEKKINHKLMMILDSGFDCLNSNPVLFEKALKLFSTLSLFPNFRKIINNN